MNILANLLEAGISLGPDVEGFYEVENIYYRNYLIKDYLWPISQNELLRNPNLVQNPGW